MRNSHDLEFRIEIKSYSGEDNRIEYTPQANIGSGWYNLEIYEVAADPRPDKDIITKVGCTQKPVKTYDNKLDAQAVIDRFIVQQKVVPNSTIEYEPYPAPGLRPLEDRLKLIIWDELGRNQGAFSNIIPYIKQNHHLLCAIRLCAEMGIKNLDLICELAHSIAELDRDLELDTSSVETIKDLSFSLLYKSKRI